MFADSKNAAWLVAILRKQSVAHRVRGPRLLRDAGSFSCPCLRPRSGEQPAPFIKNLKLTTSREYRKRFRTTLWQKKFYDHILRPRDEPAGVAGYIWMNPVRKGLCEDPWQYPYSGSFVMDWKKAYARGILDADWKAQRARLKSEAAATKATSKTVRKTRQSGDWRSQEPGSDLQHNHQFVDHLSYFRGSRGFRGRSEGSRQFFLSRHSKPANCCGGGALKCPQAFDLVLPASIC